MGISIREFARRDGCSDMLVRKAIKAGRLPALADGTLDPLLVGSGWRKANRRGQAKVPSAPADLQEIAHQAVRIEGRAPYTLVEAERIKANYLALLRQLQYDRESGAVAPIDEIAAAVASEYAIVRNNLLGIPAKLAPRLCLLRSAEELRAALETEICEVLENLSADAAYRLKESEQEP
jgi:hypothetical protein